jgi:membrane protein YqaA with SNARE-associated domain
MAAVAWRKWYVPLTGCLVGMMVGGCATLLFASSDPAAARALLDILPLSRANQLGHVSQLLKADGPRAWLIQPWSGVPFKTWAVAAAILRLNPAAVIPAFILGRGIRVGVVAAVSMGAGSRLQTFARDNFLSLLGLYVLVFAVGAWRVLG